MKKFKSMTKWLTVGALALAVAIPAGAASAATGTTVQYKVVYANAGNWAQINAMLQQYLNQYYYGAVPTKPVTPPATKPGNGSTTTKPGGSTTTKPGTTTPPSGSNSTTTSNYASQVVTLVNQERAKAGLKPLTSDAKLTNMALVKAKDMKNNNYFDHNSPTYGSPFDMMRSFGISYNYAGENIAMGQRNPQEVMNAWMNSAGHKANILNKNFTKIGVAYYNGEWVQEFTG